MDSLKLSDGSPFPSIAFGTGTTYKRQMEPVIKGESFLQLHLIYFWSHSVRISGVLSAWNVGYRSFDTARFYQTEPALGEAIQILMNEKGVKREEITVTTKIPSHIVTYEEVKWSSSDHSFFLRKSNISHFFSFSEKVSALIDDSLDKLQLKYVDLLMMHGPGPYLKEPFTRQSCKTQEQFDSLPRTPEAAKRARLEVWRAFQDAKKNGKVKHLGVSNFARKHLQQIVEDPRYE